MEKYDDVPGLDRMTQEETRKAALSWWRALGSKQKPLLKLIVGKK